MTLVTKLKTHVQFGSKDLAAQLVVNDHTSDGYVLLYHLLKNVHPQLQQNKATKPAQSTFNGNVGQYILCFKNWIQYQLSRPQPHAFDDNEVADDFLQAIKLAPWGAKLSKGIDCIETKLDCWKNADGLDFQINSNLTSLVIL